MIIYQLAISFQDAANNDLVEGIGLKSGDKSENNAQWGTVKDDLYDLDIIVSQQCEDFIAEITSNFIPDRHRLQITRFNDYSYLLLGYVLAVKECSNEKVLVYKLKCPHVFGDEAEHEFVAYWEIPKIGNGSVCAKCNRVEFDGRVFTPTTPQDSYTSYLVITELKEE